MLPHLVHLFEDDPNILYISLHRWLSLYYIEMYMYECMYVSLDIHASPLSSPLRGPMSSTSLCTGG